LGAQDVAKIGGIHRRSVQVTLLVVTADLDQEMALNR
jgi:hypothetical protein